MEIKEREKERGDRGRERRGGERRQGSEEGQKGRGGEGKWGRKRGDGGRRGAGREEGRAGSGEEGLGRGRGATREGHSRPRPGLGAVPMTPRTHASPMTTDLPGTSCFHFRNTCSLCKLFYQLHQIFLNRGKPGVCLPPEEQR